MFERMALGVFMRHGAALTFGSGSAAYAAMILSRHFPLLRQCLAALLALGLLLNGMGGSLASEEGRGGAATVVIAGTVVTICQFGDADAGGKAHAGHSCDQCALRLAPALPQVQAVASVIRFPQVVRFRPSQGFFAATRQDRRPVWPRGPPIG
ncbi:hypothetical protein RNI52_16270 [Labrys neptuniae]|uniref:hypothetical protein n=1 Tax=Labrys neptuniae TaxID=376174 RepID=UPI00288D71DF|nr:hypothetical protein [Labrys neptuniae]MDT3378889.1 hypothetical protein [Labrys neptuniae]